MRPHPFITRVLCTVVATLLTSHAAFAEDEAGDCALRIGSGPKGGVYELIVRDIQTACGNEVSVCAVPSAGGLQNLMKLSASEVDIGIAQLDTLQEMARGGDENLRNLQAVMPLHSNLLHVLALREGSKMKTSGLNFFAETRQIRKFSDLKGVRVAVVGSAQLVGQTLNSQLGYDMDFVVADNDDQAIKLLQTNKVQAIFTSGGWPMPNIVRHQHSSGLVLVEYDLTAHAPFVGVKRNYQNMDAFNFSFLAVPNLLITRPFKPTGDMGKKVGALQSCLLRNLENMQEGRFSAAWKEIKSPNDTLGIARFTRADGQKTARVNAAQRVLP